MEGVQCAVGRCPFLEDASRVEQAEDTTGHGDRELLHLGVGGRGKVVQARLPAVQLLEDGLGDEHPGRLLARCCAPRLVHAGGVRHLETGRRPGAPH